MAECACRYIYIALAWENPWLDTLYVPAINQVCFLNAASGVSLMRATAQLLCPSLPLPPQQKKVKYQRGNAHQAYRVCREALHGMRRLRRPTADAIC